MMGEFGSGRGKWVCPTDRELSLRAKLKTGWSVKTSTINSFTKPQQLSETEQEAIMKVIQRAENLEKVEQERVGRLVERLDNMKKNAMGNGTNQCVLCADEFGLLGASPLSCNDCRKAVCTKCGVDTISANKEPLWLCKICAETRETWKKSGAWFYKGLPRYILPEKKSEHQSKYATAGGALPNRPHVEHNTGSPVRCYNAWLQNKGRSSSEKEFTDSSDDEIRSTRLIRKQPNRRYLSDSVESCDSPTTSPVAKHVSSPKMSQGSPLLPYASIDNGLSLEREGNAISEGEPSYLKNTENEVYRSSVKTVESASSAANTHWYKPKKDPDEEEMVERRYGGHVRQESVSSTGSFGRSRVRVVSPAQQPVNQQLQERGAVVASDKRPSSTEETAFPESASTVEFSVLYDLHSQALHCTVHRAKGLKPTDSDGLADPYVQLQLTPAQNESDKHRTRTVHKTLNPEFNETVTFFGVTEYDMAKRTLRIILLDDDEPYNNDFLGECKLPLKRLSPHLPKQFLVYLDTTVQAEEGDESVARSQILLSLMYSSEHHALIVGILRCIHLPPRDNNSTGYCDPYVKVHLKPDQLRRRYKTATKKKTLNPEYNEEFIFELKPHETSKKMLSVTVWDKDYGKTDDYMGGLELGIQSKGARLGHWLDTVRIPDRRIERWHPLSSVPMQE